MLNKLKVVSTMLATNLVLANTALAEDYGGIGTKDASSLGETITTLVKDIGMPVGGGILFFSVCIIAIKLMVTSGNAKKRAETMEGFMYLGIGGTLLGGAIFIAGALLGIGESLGS
ncbi:MAG: hypothetical protein FH758_04090 [Firmicutes bacterium]|nr:hypothetical protein [Bacillota bacterium]